MPKNRRGTREIFKYSKITVVKAYYNELKICNANGQNLLH